MNYFEGLYTLVEIAISKNMSEDKIYELTRLVNN